MALKSASVSSMDSVKAQQSSPLRDWKRTCRYETVAGSTWVASTSSRAFMVNIAYMYAVKYDRLEA
jgi:hypothetical protein